MRAALTIIFLFSIQSFIFSETIVVPDDHATIQEAIDASDHHDTVIVKPGTHEGPINFRGKKITVKSEQGPLVTAIDGRQNGSVVIFWNNEVTNSVLDGFTITNGLSNFLGGYGGGIDCQNTAPMIVNNIISGNTATSGGGGIWCDRGSTLMVNNTILWDDSASIGPEIAIGSEDKPSSLTTIRSFDVDGGIASIVFGTIPPTWQSGEQYPFQALIDFTVLTNLTVLRVE